MHLRLPILLLLLFQLSVQLGAQPTIGYELAFPDLTFDFPVEVQPANDGSDRLFVVEQAGRIRFFDSADPAASTAATFLDMTDVIQSSTGQEKGLLGLAFHPEYVSNGYFFVYHTRESTVENVSVELVLSRYRVRTDDPNRADPDSRLEIFSFDKNQSNSNHNGGKIAFGPDGYLYVSIGDGGGGGDPKNNAQGLSTVFGSLLRIDIDVDGSNPLENNPDLPNGNYEIPGDNPRVGQSGLDELFAWGLRNTWKFALDPATNRLWGGDVGQGSFEEINLLTKGGNYGWKRFEAGSLFSNTTSLVTTPDTKPVHSYGHDNGDKSITLGYVYRGAAQNPLLQGRLVFGDFISGRVWSLDYDATTGEATVDFLFRTDGQNISSFGLDPAGELYFSGYGANARLYRVVDEADDDGGPVADLSGVGEWQAVAGGVDGVVEDVAEGDKLVYVGGSFTLAGDVQANNIAAFNPRRGWRKLGAGANGRISAVALDAEGRLFAGGDFTRIGGVDAQHIAVWDGKGWRALGAGTDGPVLALEVGPDGRVYAGGAFVQAGGQTVNNIAAWNGQQWSPLTDGGTQVAGTNNEVRSMAFDDQGTLYVGGNFASAGDRPANRIATYDGTQWGTLGVGTSGFVQAIAVTEDYVYAGGNFALAGDQTVNRIARWDRTGGSWQGVSGGVSGNVNALYVADDYLYLGGNFETVTTSSGAQILVNNLVRWSETAEWETLGTDKAVGTDNQINALTPGGATGGFYAGGSFTQAGLADATGIGYWSSARLTNGAVFELQPQHRLNLRLDVRGGSTADRAAVIGSPRDGGLSQQWTFYDQGDDVYELEPRHAPGKRLDVNNASTGNDVELILWPRHGQDNQQWRALPVGDGTFRFEPQHAPGKRMDIKHVNHRNLALSSVLDAGNSQRWRLIPVSEADRRTPATGVTSAADTELAAASPFSIFPNPADQQLNIETEVAYRLQLFDATGRQVMQRQQAAGLSKFAVGQLPAGLYVVRLTQEGREAVTRRVVIE